MSGHLSSNRADKTGKDSIRLELSVRHYDRKSASLILRWTHPNDHRITNLLLYYEDFKHAKIHQVVKGDNWDTRYRG